MEACVRGFSFMPESHVEVIDLQFIESEELERSWKVNRRHRIKEQEQKIWEEFVKENDIAGTVFKEDPYQFLSELPDSCLKDLMKTELNKMKKEIQQQDEISVPEQPKQGEGDSHPSDKTGHVTFVEEENKDSCDIFHIFDDENDNDNDNENDNEVETPGIKKEEPINESPRSPCTVRECISLVESPPPVDKRSSKSSEDVSSLVESSIYCARVKDLRLKINEEVYGMIASLDIQDVVCVEAEELRRKCRRSSEFSARFSRVHLYQLQRQMHDIKRNSNNTLPFAKHTQFQAQMARIVSLHQNMLQAVQVFHKSFEQTSCLRESSAALRGLLALVRGASVLCSAAPAPRDLAAAAGLYKDELLVTCDRLDEALDEYTVRVADFLNNMDDNSTKSSRKSKKSLNKAGRKLRSTLSSSKSGSKSNLETDTRLSMYSLDTMRVSLRAKHSGGRDHSSVNYKLQAPPSSLDMKLQDKTQKSPKTPKKSPRSSRRPLMRAPSGSRMRTRVTKDTDITTMVEAVGCTSSHISREPSPHWAPRLRPARAPARKAQTSGQGQRLRNSSPKAKVRRSSPKPSQILKALTSIKTDSLYSDETGLNLKAVSKIYPNKELKEKAAHAERILREIGYSARDNKESRQSKDSSPRNYSLGFRDGRLSKESSPRTLNHGLKEGWHSKESSPRNYGLVGKDIRLSAREESNSVRDRDRRDNNVSQEMAVSLFQHLKDSPKLKKADYVGSAREDENPVNKEAVEGTLTEMPKISHRKSDDKDGGKSDRSKASSGTPARCEVTRLLRQLCSTDTTTSGGRSERVTGAKNAQLVCVNSASPRQPTTPQLLRILEETIQKKTPKPMFVKPPTARDPDRYRLAFNVPEKTAAQMMHYRTKFVQHMLTSSMYANGNVGKPWEIISSISEKMIDEVLTACVKEMELQDMMQELYKSETT